MPKPTFISETEVAWNSTAATITTASISVQAGDIIVVLAGKEDSVQAGNQSISNSGAALTWTDHQSGVDVSGYCETHMWSAVADSTRSLTISITKANTVGGQGCSVLVFRDSDGVGNSAKANSTTGGPSVNVTTTQDNSAIVVVSLDWNVVSGASRVWRTVNSVTPTAGNNLERVYQLVASAYTCYGAYYDDAGTAGSKTVGLSTPSSGMAWSIIAVEIKGTASGGTAHTLSVSDSLSFSDTPAKQPSIPKTETITFADSKALQPGKVLSDSFSLSEALAKTPGKVLSDSFSLSEALAKQAGKVLTDSVTLEDSFAGAIVIALSVSDSLTLSDSKVFQTGKVLTETLSLSDTFSRVGSFVRSFSDSLSIADSAAAVNLDADIEEQTAQIRWGKYLNDRRRIARENVRLKKLQKLARIRI